MFLGLLQRVYEWLTLEDYEIAKRKAERDVVARFSRGNVAIQNGHFLSKNDIQILRSKVLRAQPAK
jgi:sialic acid synthase SpsE